MLNHFKYIVLLDRFSLLVCFYCNILYFNRLNK